jgi:hypothetical protein
MGTGCSLIRYSNSRTKWTYFQLNNFRNCFSPNIIPSIEKLNTPNLPLQKITHGRPGNCLRITLCEPVFQRFAARLRIRRQVPAGVLSPPVDELSWRVVRRFPHYAGEHWNSTSGYPSCGGDVVIRSQLHIMVHRRLSRSLALACPWMEKCIITDFWIRGITFFNICQTEF